MSSTGGSIIVTYLDSEEYNNIAADKLDCVRVHWARISSLSLRLIFRPQDVILAPDGKGAMKDFCSQNCLTSFNYKRSTAAKKSTHPTAPQSLCSMCTRYCIVSQTEQGCNFHSLLICQLSWKTPAIISQSSRWNLVFFLIWPTFSDLKIFS